MYETIEIGDIVYANDAGCYKNYDRQNIPNELGIVTRITNDAVEFKAISDGKKLCRMKCYLNIKYKYNKSVVCEIY